LIIGDGKNPDGSHSAEALAYVALCMQQIRANLRTFFERNQWIKQAPDGNIIDDPAEAPDRIHDELGVKTTEQKKGFE
jgi:hypothetical protein